MIKRGRILRDTNAGPGLLNVEGTQYRFVLEGMWQSEIPPRAGMPVDVLFTDAGAPDKVIAVPESQIAQEQVGKVLSGALRQGEAVRSGLTQRFRIGTILAEALLLVTFFFLPWLIVENPMGFGRVALTGWQVTGFDPKNMTGLEHGVLSLVAVLCIFVPLAVPFVKRAGANWLNASPLACLVLIALVIYSQIATAGRAAGAEIGNMFGADTAQQISRDLMAHIHIGLGAWLSAVCAIYLFTRAFRNRPVSE